MTGTEGNIEFCFLRISTFPSTSFRETLRFEGNKIHCFPTGYRSNDGILLSHPTVKTLTTLDDRAFVASAPKLWNDLPLEIRMAKSVDTKKF